MGEKPRHFLSLWDYSAEEIRGFLEEALRQKRALREGNFRPTHRGRVLACIFHKPSLRTRVSFEVAMHQLGGSSLYITDREIRVGTREAPKDVARVLSRYVDAIMIRTFDQGLLEELAEWSSVPVINGLTDLLHPCQVLADLLTILEHRGDLEGLTVAFVGDGNNMARSWVNAAARLGFRFVLACPEGYGLSRDFLRPRLEENPEAYREVHDPIEAVREAQVIYTDVWTSMGQEEEAERRRRDFRNFQVNEALLEAAPGEAVVLHCLPAHRGEEITDVVMESPRALVFDQAENRLHAQRALLSRLVPPGVVAA
jgi:ornithine carbamoyltransferase